MAFLLPLYSIGIMGILVATGIFRMRGAKIYHPIDPLCWVGGGVIALGLAFGKWLEWIELKHKKLIHPEELTLLRIDPDKSTTSEASTSKASNRSRQGRQGTSRVLGKEERWKTL